MPSIGIGVIGSGFMGSTYAEVVARHVPGARLAGIAGGRHAARLSREYGVPPAPSVDALLARKDLHGVILATPDRVRLDLTRQAAAAGKHVLAEKPMAPTVSEGDAMIDTCSKAGVHLAVVKTERYRKVCRKAKQLIDDGLVGPVFMVRSLSSFPINFTRELFEARQWMNAPGSGGLFLGMATHNTDFLRWLIGADATRVYAQVTTYSDLP